MLARPSVELLTMGRTWLSKQHAEEANALFRAAAITANASAEHEVEADALTELGNLAYHACDLVGAHAAYSKAAVAYAESSAITAALRSHVRLAFLALDRGDVEQAALVLSKSRQSAEQMGATQLVHLIDGYRGNVARRKGEFQRAQALYANAARALRAENDLRYAHTFEMDAAIAALLEARPRLALEQLATLVRDADEAGHDADLRGLMRHYLAFALHKLGRHGEAIALGGSVTGSQLAQRLSEARELATRLAGAKGTRDQRAARRGLNDMTLTFSNNEHLRIAMQLLRNTLEVDHKFMPMFLRRGEKSVIVGGNAIALAANKSAWRIVNAFADAHATNKSMSVAELAECAWASERLLPHAARNRVHVALSFLRKAGLAEVMQVSSAGYALAPELDIVRLP